MYIYTYIFIYNYILGHIYKYIHIYIIMCSSLYVYIYTCQLINKKTLEYIRVTPGTLYCCYQSHYGQPCIPRPRYGSVYLRNGTIPVFYRPSDKSLLSSLLVQTLTGSTPGHAIWRAGDDTSTFFRKAKQSSWPGPQACTGGRTQGL